MIADAKTSEQKNYKIGDQIEDARLIRILPNRVILIRTNGQKETLYLNEKDIMQNPTALAGQNNWTQIVKKIHDELFLLDPDTFVVVAHNIARLIDILDFTSVYKQGESIGCKVGNITSESLGIAMGLKPYDIITHIDDLPLLN